MPDHCLLYYITDRTQFPGTESERQAQLLKQIQDAARAGIDFIQLREKDLSARELETLAREAVTAVRQNSQPDHPTRILINSRTDVALAAHADGVHVRADDISPAEVRRIWRSATVSVGEGAVAAPLVATSCHTYEDIDAAEQNRADFAVFGPVFEKRDSPAPPAGLEGLRRACQHKIRVFALGGVTLDNAAACLQAGAAGIAAIRLFQENNTNQIVDRLIGR